MERETQIPLRLRVTMLDCQVARKMAVPCSNLVPKASEQQKYIAKELLSLEGGLKDLLERSSQRLQNVVTIGRDSLAKEEEIQARRRTQSGQLRRERGVPMSSANIKRFRRKSQDFTIREVNSSMSSTSSSCSSSIHGSSSSSNGSISRISGGNSSMGSTIRLASGLSAPNEALTPTPLSEMLSTFSEDLRYERAEEEAYSRHVEDLARQPRRPKNSRSAVWYVPRCAWPARHLRPSRHCKSLHPITSLPLRLRPPSRPLFRHATPPCLTVGHPRPCRRTLPCSRPM